MITVNKLDVPECWADVNFRQYNRLLALQQSRFEASTSPANDITQDTIILTEITDTDTAVAKVQEMNIQEYNQCIKSLEFLTKPVVYLPEFGFKPKFKWEFININDLTYDKWMATQKVLEHSPEDMLSILKLNTKHTEEELLELSVPEVLYGFFILGKKSRNFIRSTQWSFLRIIVKVYLIHLWRVMKNLITTGRKYGRAQ